MLLRRNCGVCGVCKKLKTKQTTEIFAVDFLTFPNLLRYLLHFPSLL
jgi:hypothetical protein